MLAINFDMENHVGTMKQDVFYISANPNKRFKITGFKHILRINRKGFVLGTHHEIQKSFKMHAQFKLTATINHKVFSLNFIIL